MEHRLSFHGSKTDWRRLARFPNDGRRDALQRIFAQRHSPHQHANALGNGRGRIFATYICGEASEIWHAVDRHSDFIGDLRAAGVSYFGATAYRVRMAAHARHGAHRALGVAIAQEISRDEEAVRYSVGKCWTALRCYRTHLDGHSRIGLQRSVRIEMGSAAGTIWRAGLFCVWQIQVVLAATLLTKL